jgi:uncharacterized protein YbbC (DUF1343 family)
MLIKYFSLFITLIFLCSPVHKESVTRPATFRLGNEVLLSNLDKIKSKKIGLITNQTGILSDGTHILDALIEKNINVTKIFSPEHGIRGDENYSNIDEKTSISIISLYNGKNKPSKDDLNNVDILIYDIQDVGSRFYTYTSTLYYCLESATENNIPIIICDRPIIINPEYVDGFMLENGFESFVGKIPTTVCYGMTCGELANFLNGTLFSFSALIEISKMENYNRTTDYDSLKLKWIKPSPSMFYSSTALCYPAACFLEGTNVSEGRGTPKPFEYIGAPWCNSNELSQELNSYNLKGVTFEPDSFTPSEKISAYPPKFFNQNCNGVFINVTNKVSFEPCKVSVAILYALHKLYPQFKFNKDNFIDKLAGTDKLRKMINSNSSYQDIISSWQEFLTEFISYRSKYLLY